MPRLSKAVRGATQVTKRRAMCEVSTLEKIRGQRLIKMTRQNERLKIELEKIKGTHVALESIKRIVVTANTVVKQQLLAVGPRTGTQLAACDNPAECSRIVTEAISLVLDDLAYDQPVSQGSGVPLDAGRA